MGENHRLSEAFLDFLQTRIQLVIRFLDLFKGSLWKNSEEASARAGMQNRKLE